MKNLKMDIEAGFSYRTSGPVEDRDFFHVRVHDDISGQVILAFVLDKNQFMSFLNNSGRVEVEGEITEHFHRVGKKMEHASTSVRNLYGEEADAAAERIRQEFLDNGWESVTISRRNYGLEVLARKWVDAE